jgi:nucleoside-diphosphate-sugar epimerase
MKRQVTVSGTENILKVALEKKVHKVIHFSTAAVHGLNPNGPMVDESAPFNPGREIYRSSKAQAEELVWHYHKKHGLPVVVFRPPIIYGPFGAYWTARIVQEIQTGAILVNNGSGAANLIYVDNLIDAVILAMEKDAANGEAFNVVDDDGLTWGQVYKAYAGLVDSHPPLRSMSVKEIEDMRKADAPNDLRSWFVKPFSLIPHFIKTSFRSPEMRRKMMEIPWLRFMKNHVPRQTLDQMKYGENSNRNVSTKVNEQRVHPLLPDNDLVDLYSSQCRFSNHKIKNVLGFKQRVTFNEALKLIGSWLRYQRSIP